MKPLPPLPARQERRPVKARTIFLSIFFVLGAAFYWMGFFYWPLEIPLNHPVRPMGFSFGADFPENSFIEESEYPAKWAAFLIPDESNPYKPSPWNNCQPALGESLDSPGFLCGRYKIYFTEDRFREKNDYYFSTQIELTEGFPSGATLNDFGVLSKKVPQTTFLGAAKSVKLTRGKHPTLGEFEEAWAFRNNPNSIAHYARQRVYVTGGRRYVLTFTANEAFWRRTAGLREEFFANGLEFDPQNTWRPRLLPKPKQLTDSQLLVNATEHFKKAQALEAEADGEINNAAYRAFLSYREAASFCERLPKLPEFHGEAVSKMREIHEPIQTRLKSLLDEAWEHTSWAREDEARRAILQIQEIVAIEKSEPLFVPREEWATWAELLLEEIERARRSRSTCRPARRVKAIRVR